MVRATEVQDIALLDLRIVNTDRNGCNMLVKKIYLDKQEDPYCKNFNLHVIPIDHGLCFPEALEIYEWEVQWMQFDSVKEPLHQKAMDVVLSMDPKAEMDMLQQILKLSLSSLCIFRCVSLLTKTAILD